MEDLITGFSVGVYECKNAKNQIHMFTKLGQLCSRQRYVF